MAAAMSTALDVHPSLTLRGRCRRLWHRLAPHRRRTPGTVSVTLTADTTRLMVSLAAAGTAANDYQVGVDRMGTALRATQRHFAYAHERALCRGEARWYIRGGLGPLLIPIADRPAERDAQVQAMLAAGLPARWVAAYLDGWCDSFGSDPAPRDRYVLHTLWPGHTHLSAIQVSA